jgi:gas vesicle protein
MRRTLCFMFGAMVGGLVGSVAILLLTPSSGVEIREKLGTRIQELIEEGKRAAASRRVELEAQLEAFKRGVPIGGEASTPEPQA